MVIRRGNLFEDAAPPQDGERFDALLRHRNLVVERILSSPRPGTGEYVQEQDEWVVLLEGQAELELRGARLELQAGDWLFIPAGAPHRVLSASADPACLWLAVHLHPGERGGAGPPA